MPAAAPGSLRRAYGSCQHVEHARDGRDAWAVPVVEPWPERAFALAMDEDGIHPDAAGAGKLVVCAVAHEHGFVRLEPEQPAAMQVDLRIGLRHADTRREHLGIEEAVELRLGPERLDV